MIQNLRRFTAQLIKTKGKILTFLKCLKVGLIYNRSWLIQGKFFIKRPNRFHVQPDITIGDKLHLQAKLTSNSFGIIQPNYFHFSPGAKLVIGNNVGISGSTISVAKSVVIGDNVLIGSGCVISDTDSHPINPVDRHDHSKTISKPILIENDVFIGARTIVLKGVTIGKGAVIGAGSVVSKSIPENVIAAGNPASVLREIKKA